MRIDINLASRPYQDLRRFYLTWGGALAFMFLLTALLLTFAGIRLREARQGWRMVEQKRSDIARLQSELDEAARTLNLPENRGTRDHSQFINEAIVRKSFSWTKVFADLERLMPARVHLVSISPELDKQGRLVVKMMVNSERREGAVQLVRQLETSPQFRYPRLLIETEGKETGPDSGVKAQIEAYYRLTESASGQREGQ